MVLSLLVFSERDDFCARICKQLAATPHARVAAVATRSERLAEAIAQAKPDLLFADLERDPQRVLDALAALETCPPLVVSGPSDDAGLILRALDLGARHFFPGEPSSDDLERTLGRLVTDSAEAASRPAAPIIAVMGAKGGVGASFVACQLAVSLQAQGARTAVVDLNLPLGDVALYFDLRPRYTLAHVARDAEQLDAAYLRGALVQHHSGVSVLAAPARLDEAMLIKADHVDRVLRLLAADFDYVVVDVSREWKETSIRALDAASQVLLVTLSDVATLSQARKHLELLRRLGQPEQALHLVTNRDTASGHLSDDDYLGFLGRAPEARIPNDFASTLLSVNEGRPVGEIAPRGSLQLAYDALARQLATWCGRSLGPEPEPEPTPVPPTPPSRPLRSVGVAPAALCSASPRPTGWDESPRAFQVLTVASNKGGVGKTTIATNLAVFLRALREDLPILVLEFDDQTMPDRMFAIDSSSGAPDVAAALRSGSLADAVRLGQYGVHYVPSSPDMSALKREIEDPFYLQSVLLRSGWQGLVIIDTKSDLEILTQNAIAASDLSIVVVHDLASLQQAEKLYGLLDRWGVSRERARVLLSLVDRRIKYTEGEDVLGFLISRIRALGLPLFEAFLSRSHRIEALYTNPEGRAHSILHGAPNSLVHRQMRHLAQDVIQLLETQRQQPKRVVPETPAAPATVPTPAALPLPAAADPRSATPRRWLEYASGARSWARSRLGGAS